MPRETVKLISSEGFEFIVGYEAACVSGTIKSMLCGEGSFTETEMGEITFPEISAPVLEKACQYFYYKLHYQNSLSMNLDLVAAVAFCYAAGYTMPIPPLDRTSKNIPDFKVPPEMALELLMAADFLDS